VDLLYSTPSSSTNTNTDKNNAPDNPNSRPVTADLDINLTSASSSGKDMSSQSTVSLAAAQLDAFARLTVAGESSGRQQRQSDDTAAAKEAPLPMAAEGVKATNAAAPPPPQHRHRLAPWTPLPWPEQQQRRQQQQQRQQQQAHQPAARVTVACMSRAGQDPGRKKTNQDSCVAYQRYVFEDAALFGAMDGHGPLGERAGVG
jgi:hypothetical protein